MNWPTSAHYFGCAQIFFTNVFWCQLRRTSAVFFSLLVHVNCWFFFSKWIFSSIGKSTMQKATITTTKTTTTTKNMLRVYKYCRWFRWTVSAILNVHWVADTSAAQICMDGVRHSKWQRESSHLCIGSSSHVNCILCGIDLKWETKKNDNTRNTHTCNNDNDNDTYQTFLDDFLSVAPTHTPIHLVVLQIEKCLHSTNQMNIHILRKMFHFNELWTCCREEDKTC